MKEIMKITISRDYSDVADKMLLRPFISITADHFIGT